MDPIMLISRGKRFSVSNPICSYAFVTFHQQLEKSLFHGHSDHPRRTLAAEKEVPAERLQRNAMLLIRFATTVKRAKEKKNELSGAVSKPKEHDVLKIQQERKKQIQIMRKAAREALEKVEEAAPKYDDAQFLQDLKVLGLYRDYSLPSPLF